MLHSPAAVSVKGAVEHVQLPNVAGGSGEIFRFSRTEQQGYAGGFWPRVNPGAVHSIFDMTDPSIPHEALTWGDFLLFTHGQYANSRPTIPRAIEGW